MKHLPSVAAVMPFRWLAVLRLSRDADTKESLKRHRIEIEEFIQSIGGGVIVGWAEDPDVSATRTTPFQRPELGPWLKKRLDEFDGIVVWKMDRIVRSSAQTRELLMHLTTHGKRLTSVKESIIDFDPNSTDKLKKLICELFMQVTVMIAEMEADNIRTRIGSHKDLLRKWGYWPGGNVPYGFELVKGTLPGAPIAGKILTPVPDRIAIVKEMGRLVISRVPTKQIAEILTRRGVPTSSVASGLNMPDHWDGFSAWNGQSIKQILTNRIHLGEHHENGETIRGDDGMPIRFCPSTFSLEDFEQIQREFDRRARHKSTGYENQMRFFSGAIECLGCGKPLYLLEINDKGKIRHYYRCGTNHNKTAIRIGKDPCPAHAKSVVGARLHEYVDEMVCGPLGKHELHEDHYVEGLGSYEEAERIRSALRTLVTDFYNGEYESPFLAELYHEKKNELSRRLDRMTADGVELSHWERRPTGKTLWDEWQAADWTRKRELLRMAGLTVRAMPGKNGVIEVVEAEDTAQRLADYAAGKPLRDAPKPPPTAQIISDEEVRNALLAGIARGGVVLDDELSQWGDGVSDPVE